MCIIRHIMEKITRDNIVKHLQEFQLKMVGKTYQDAENDPEWYHNNTFNVEQLTDFNVYALPLIKKVLKVSNKKAKAILGEFSLNWGLRVVPTRDERIDIEKKLKEELNNN